MSVLREGKVFVRSVFAGVIQETDEGYLFQYDEAYLSRKMPAPFLLHCLCGLQFTDLIHSFHSLMG